MFKTEDWTAVRVHQGQQTLNSCIHTAVHMDAEKARGHITLKKSNKLADMLKGIVQHFGKFTSLSFWEMFRWIAISCLCVKYRDCVRMWSAWLSMKTRSTRRQLVWLWTNFKVQLSTPLMYTTETDWLDQIKENNICTLNSFVSTLWGTELVTNDWPAILQANTDDVCYLGSSLSLLLFAGT